MSVKDELENLLDYNNSVLNGNQRGYGNYSPNNLKSIIISFDGIYVRYHKPSLVSNAKREIVNLGNKYVKDYISCINSPTGFRNYKAAFLAIAGVGARSRVCSALEEIIFLTPTSNPNFKDYFYGAEVSEAIAQFRDKGLSNKFKRLRRISVFDMPYPSFINAVKSHYMRDKDLQYTLISDWAEKCNLKPSLSIPLNESDWYECLPSTVGAFSTYAVENELNDYFTAVRDKFREQKKESEINKFKSDKENEKLKEEEKWVRKYETLFLGYKDLFSAEPSELLVCDSNLQFNFPRLRESAIQSKIPSSASETRKAEDVYKSALKDYGIFLSDLVIDNLDTIKTGSPIVFKLIMRELGNDMSVFKDNNLNLRVDMSLHSIINCSYLLSYLFFNTDNAKKNRDYWDKKIVYRG